MNRLLAYHDWGKHHAQHNNLHSSSTEIHSPLAVQKYHSIRNESGM
jgi:hypothetical protein